MKFLVIGASGFVGRHVLDYVKSKAYETLGIQSRSELPGLISFDLLQHRIGDCVPSSLLDGQKAEFGVLCKKSGLMDGYVLEP